MALWRETVQTLALVLAASAVALAVGIPAGIAMARSKLIETVARPVLDFMQTMPSFVYLISDAIFFGLGAVPGAIAYVVFFIPTAVRLIQLWDTHVASVMFV